MLLRRLDGGLQRLVLRREHGLQALLNLGAVFRAGQNLLIAHGVYPFFAVLLENHTGDGEAPTSRFADRRLDAHCV